MAPVVGYRVDRGRGGRRAVLTAKPLLLDRHLRRGEPEFLDGAPPAGKLTYQVLSVDVFGRASAPARTGIALNAPAAAPPRPAPKRASGAHANAVRSEPQAEPAARRAGPPPPVIVASRGRPTGSRSGSGPGSRKV